MESFLSDAAADERAQAAQQRQQSDFFVRFPHLREFFCGGTAAAINIVVTFPPNKVMFRQQVGKLFSNRLTLAYTSCHLKH